MLTMLIFMVVAMVALSYFGRRQNAKAEQAARNRLEEACVPDTWVRTTSGYYAKFVEIDGDVVTLRTPQGVESMWDRKPFMAQLTRLSLTRMRMKRKTLTLATS